MLEATNQEALRSSQWIVHEIAHFVETGDHLAEPMSTEVHDVLCGHLESERSTARNA